MTITDSFSEEIVRINRALKNAQKNIDALEPNHVDDLKTYIFDDLSNDINVVKQEYINNCDHCNIILVSHDSMITGREPGYKPNPNHISYYCLRCGKKISQKELEDEEITSRALIIDAYGHEDALLIGYESSKAIVDYIRAIINDLAQYQLEFPEQAPFEDDAVRNIIDIKNLRVPEEYIRRK